MHFFYLLHCLLFVSCSDDDDATPTLDLSDDQIDDIVDDIVDSGPVLADGIYIVGPSVSADTTSANLLQAGNVGAPEFGNQLRTGFYEGMSTWEKEIILS